MVQVFIKICSTREVLHVTFPPHDYYIWNVFLGVKLNTVKYEDGTGREGEEEGADFCKQSSD